MAHVRRKFCDLVEAHKSSVATEALKRIAELYVIEGEIWGRSPDDRRELRTLRSRPLLDSLKQWLEETLAKLSRKSPESDEQTLVAERTLGCSRALLRRWSTGD